MASTRLDNAPFYYEKCMGLDSALASGLCPPLESLLKKENTVF